MFRELQYQQWLYDIFKERTWYWNLIGLYTKKKLVLLVENIWKEEAKKNFGRLTLDFTKLVVNLHRKWGFYQEILHSIRQHCNDKFWLAVKKLSVHIHANLLDTFVFLYTFWHEQTQNSDFQIQMKNWEIDQ